MFTPGDAPVLVQSQSAGNNTTSVGDRGAAVLDKMLKMSALPYGDLGATRHNPSICLEDRSSKGSSQRWMQDGYYRRSAIFQTH